MLIVVYLIFGIAIERVVPPACEHVGSHQMKVPEGTFLHELFLGWLWIDGGRVCADVMGTGINLGCGLLDKSTNLQVLRKIIEDSG